jgi:hypothetical protein
MFLSESSTDAKPPVGAGGAAGANGVSVEKIKPGTSLTNTTGVLNSLMINVAVLRGVGVLVRVGICVWVGVLEAVGLFVGVLAGPGLGIRSIVEQARVRSAMERMNSNLRIRNSQEHIVFIIPLTK